MNVDTLRKHLFEAIDGLRSGNLDVEKAKAISDIGQTIINSAKVEVEYLKAVDGSQSNFLSGEALPKGVVGIRQHRIK